MSEVAHADSFVEGPAVALGVVTGPGVASGADDDVDEPDDGVVTVVGAADCVV